MNEKLNLSEGETNRSSRRNDWYRNVQDSATQSLLQRDERAFLHQAVSTPCMNTISRAQGAWIWDGQGRKYLDFHGNNVHHIGYGHPRLKEAIARQMDILPFAPRRYACEPAVELAEKLGAIAPGALSKLLFTTGGSDANEVALKIARAKTGRFKTLSFWDSFHGAGFGASSVGGEALFRSGITGPLLPGSEHVAPFNCYRCPYGHPIPETGREKASCGLACANMVRFALEREGDIAAVIAEPARAAPYIPPKGFWQEVRQACDDHGALLIFDEIPTGLGKTGRMFACDHDETVPDLLVMGKALGGGILPIAAVLAHPDLDVTGDYAIGHYTHEKNPVTAKAALTTIEIIEDEQLVENAARQGSYAFERLNALAEDFHAIGDVRGRGLLIGIELVKDRETRMPDEALAEDIFYRCLEKGLSFKITMGNILTWTPPLIVTREQMDIALATFEEASRTARNGKFFNERGACELGSDLDQIRYG